MSTSSKHLQLTKEPIAKAEMLIRKPPSEVFEAFINPAITTKFWFTKSSGRLETGKRVTWEWEMYRFSVQVEVKTIEQNKRIVVQWPYHGTQTTIEWIFTAYGNDATYVSVTNAGFGGNGDKVVADALESTGGFTWVLAGLKAYLEHGVLLNLIADAYPSKARLRVS
jgi:uncharacterized protein YndB with AHSA1/START domain